jgi:hypothetical protein
VRPSPLSRLNLISVDFVTSTVGFTLTGVGAANRSRLYATADVGQSWHPVPAILLP